MQVCCPGREYGSEHLIKLDQLSPFAYCCLFARGRYQPPAPLDPCSPPRVRPVASSSFDLEADLGHHPAHQPRNHERHHTSVVRSKSLHMSARGKVSFARRRTHAAGRQARSDVSDGPAYDSGCMPNTPLEGCP